MYNYYIDLVTRAEAMVTAGMHDLDPVVRSIYRKAAKVYLDMNADEKGWADTFNELPFH